MKILRLDLRAFGPFAGVVLDLSQGSEGLHVVYGPNEAGKSSALRAIEHALFGIPAQTADAFRHSYQNLRIGATLADRQGNSITFLRRKGNANTLLAADGLTPLADTALRPILGGLDRDTFRTMFGIGHESLVEGGRELARGGGSIGQVLFAAGTGIADLQAIEEGLRGESEELFKPRATTKRINKTLKELDEARRRARQPRVSSDDWTRRDQALSEAQSQRDRVQAEWQRVQAERHRLERLEQALPLISRRKRLLDQRAGLGTVTILPADFADQRRQADANLQIARKSLDGAATELLRIDAALDEIHVPEPLVARADEIRELSDALGAHRKASRDLPGLVGGREQLEQSAAELLRQLRPTLALAEAERLRLTRLEQVTIQDLGNRHDALVQALGQARSEILETRRQLEDEESALQSLDLPRDSGPLKQATRQAQAEGDLERSLAEALARAQRSEEQAAIGLARLGLWSGTSDQLERLAVPSPETIDRFDKELADVERRIGLADARLHQSADARADVGRQIDQARSQGDVPSAQDLEAARRLREQGWQLVLRVWRGGEPERLGEFLAKFPGRDLAGAYEESVRAADELSDRLRREADRVATLAALGARAEGLDAQLKAATGDLESLQAEREGLAAAWQGCWRAMGIEPLRPREMRSWLVAQQALVAQAETIRPQRVQCDGIRQRLAAHRGRQAELLAELGEPCAEGESLSILLGRAESLAARIDAAAVGRETLQKSMRQLAQRKSAAEVRREQAGAELAEWRNRWGIAVEKLGLASDATPAAANAVLGQLNELFAHLADAQKEAVRIEGIRHDREAFAQRVAELARAAAPDLAVADPEAAAESLRQQLDRAKIAQSERQALQADRRRRSAEREKAQAAIDALTARLATLCREANCRKPEELPQAERVSAEAQRLDQALAELDSQLAGLAAGATIECFTAEAEGVAADELPGCLAELRWRIDQFDHDRAGLDQEIGSQRQALAQMRAESDATTAAEDVQELLARLEPDVTEYVRLRLALRLLREGMEHYRAKNEGPVLRQAAELFREFTLGRFEGLRVDEENGQKVLKGVRANEEPKLLELAAMSDGTADQLYLALRLASLESHLEGREPVPLIVDDVLIRFDDDRSAAALRALAALSRKTQVIFFTHHPHLVELARRHVAENDLFLHNGFL